MGLGFSCLGVLAPLRLGVRMGWGLSGSTGPTSTGPSISIGARLPPPLQRPPLLLLVRLSLIIWGVALDLGRDFLGVLAQPQLRVPLRLGLPPVLARLPPRLQRLPLPLLVRLLIINYLGCGNVLIFSCLGVPARL